MTKEKHDTLEPIEQYVRSMPFYKKIIFALVPLAILLILLETGARLVYYQVHGNHKSALVAAFHKLQNKVALAVSTKKVEVVENRLPKGAKGALFNPEGAELLAYFQGQYEKSFAELVEETGKLGSRLIVLYPPSNFSKDPRSRDLCQSFFKGLAGKYRVDFADVTAAFARYPAETVTLLPQNGHLSRFGNQVVVEELAKYIQGNASRRRVAAFSTRPPLLGDLLARENKIWLFAPEMPYRVVVNSQGLRMDRDLQFPKTKPRILCLGDSFTFGPYLANHDTYPGLLQQKYPDKEVINAGICGYTIADEVSLLKQRAKYCEPDIIILQVLDNDLMDFFYFRRQVFARDRQDFKPTPQEEEYLARLRALESKPAQASRPQ
ncbi:MAG: hypothetical protein FJ121_00245 [Deltaproteobacteria bacterium]|nr:hypothetical protein [Deltaproteobacteria bacterium]